MHARTKVTVRYAETDRMGIVHHSNYPIWYEIARNDYIKMFGISYTDMENFGIPALYEDELIIRTWVQTITAARIIFTYTVKRIEKDGSETELGYGTTEHGFVDSKTFRPTSIKKRFPKLYEDISAAVKHF